MDALTAGSLGMAGATACGGVATAGDASRGGVPGGQKRPESRGGSGVPKNADFWRFWAKKGDFWPFSGKSGQKVFKNATFCTSIAPRLKGGCPRGKNPPIYTVLNAAFSAPPPPGAPWWDTTPRRPPTASRSRPRVQASQACPQDDGVGFLLRH